MQVKKYEIYVKPKLEVIAAWTRNGVNERTIAKNLDVSYSCFRDYKKKHAALAKALENNCESADLKVENALYKRAVGYKFDEVTKELVTKKDKYGGIITDENGVVLQELKITKVVTKEVQPDVGAQQFWLKNRKSKDWRDKQEVEMSGSLGVKIVDDIE